MSAVIDALPLPNVYYDHRARGYWRSDGSGKWISINEDMARKFLATQGYSNKINDNVVSDADQCLLDIQSGQNIDFAGELAGYMAGHYTINGSKVLVTRSPTLITPSPGNWPLMEHILNGMFNGSEGRDQLNYFLSWLQRAIRSYYQHTWTQSQVVAMAGPVGCGKSLLQLLLTKMFGGRSASVHQYMTGRTNFNSELFRAEHLMIEDDREQHDYAGRKELGSHIKQIAVNQYHACYGKHKEALSLSPIWRMSISLNDEPDRLQVLPPIEEDIEDKIMLFKIQKQIMPMPTATHEERIAFEAALINELPALINYLMHEWVIPQDIQDQRYGVRAFHHPEILHGLDSISPEQALLDLIDQAFSYGIDHATAATIHTQLIRHCESSIQRQAASLLKNTRLTGSWLTALSKRDNPRVTKRVLEGVVYYTIQAAPGNNQRANISRFGGGTVEPIFKFEGENHNNKDGNLESNASPAPTNMENRSTVPPVPLIAPTGISTASQNIQPPGLLEGSSRIPAPPTAPILN